MSKQKKASFETSVRSNRIVLASSIPIDLARMYFIQSPQSFADRSPTNHTQFLSCNRPGRQPTRQPQTELWQTARAGQNQPYHLRPNLLTYLPQPSLPSYILASLYFYQPLTFISDDIILFIVTKNGCEIATTLRTAFSSPLQPCTYVSSLVLA